MARAIPIGWPGLIGKCRSILLGNSHRSLTSRLLIMESTQDNLRVGGSGDLGECVQVPIARRFAPNVCSALAPPGACSQARWEPLRDIKRGRQNISRIENQWRKIEIFFISLKHPFLWTSFEKNILKFQRSFFRAKCEKVWKFVKIAVFSLPKRLNRHATLERCWQR